MKITEASSIVDFIRDKSRLKRRSITITKTCRLLKAAEDAFARDGLDVPLHLIAEKAGVGRATLYRNFADRSALVLAIFVEQIEDLGRRTRARLDDPDAFLWFLEQLVALLHSGQSGDYRGMPPAGVAVLEFPAEAAIEPGVARLSRFWWP